MAISTAPPAKEAPTAMAQFSSWPPQRRRAITGPKPCSIGLEQAPTDQIQSPASASIRRATSTAQPPEEAQMAMASCFNWSRQAAGLKISFTISRMETTGVFPTLASSPTRQETFTAQPPRAAPMEAAQFSNSPPQRAVGVSTKSTACPDGAFQEPSATSSSTAPAPYTPPPTATAATTLERFTN